MTSKHRSTGGGCRRACRRAPDFAILVTFPDHEPMPPEVGKTIVPDVIGGGNLHGESTLFGCLFSDNW